MPLKVAAYQIWGANTGIGKSLISAGLAKAAVKTNTVSLQRKTKLNSTQLAF